jgi:hypothetical protein
MCPFIQKFLYGIKAQSLLFIHVPQHLSFLTNNKASNYCEKIQNFLPINYKLKNTMGTSNWLYNTKALQFNTTKINFQGVSEWLQKIDIIE